METLPDHSDVVIIGAGVAGLSAAYFLAKVGVQTTVIDRTVTPSGASARCIGVPWLGFLDTPWRLEQAIGDGRTSEILSLCRENSELAHTLVPTKTATWVWANQGNTLDNEWLHSLHVLKKNQFSVYPFESKLQTMNGIQFPHQWRIAPIEGLNALQKRCLDHQALICRGIEALDVGLTAQGSVVHTNRGSITADAVVFATGAWTGSLLDGFSNKVVAVREHVQTGRWCTEGSNASVRAQNGYIQWQSHQKGWSISGARWATPHLEVGETDDTKTPSAISAALVQFRNGLNPSPTDPSGARSYLWAKTCDGLPILGPLPGQSTWICCTGFMGNDWGFGIRAGKAVADGLLSGTAPGIPEWLTATRFL